jgi:hypothetical protein
MVRLCRVEEGGCCAWSTFGIKKANVMASRNTFVRQGESAQQPRMVHALFVCNPGDVLYAIWCGALALPALARTSSAFWPPIFPLKSWHTLCTHAPPLALAFGGV